MSLPNTIMLTSTKGQVDVIGDPVNVSETVGRLFTIAIHLSYFQGRVILEGSLSPNPNPQDWFIIQLPDNLDFTASTTRTFGYNFTGRFAVLRIRQERSHLGIGQFTEQQLAPFGFIDKVVLNMGSWV